MIPPTFSHRHRSSPSPSEHTMMDQRASVFYAQKIGENAFKLKRKRVHYYGLYRFAVSLFLCGLLVPRFLRVGPGCCCVDPLFFGTRGGGGWVRKRSLRSFIAGLYTGLYLVSFGGLSWAPYKRWPGNPTVIILGFVLRREGAPNYPFMLRHTRLPPSLPVAPATRGIPGHQGVLPLISPLPASPLPPARLISLNLTVTPTRVTLIVLP